MILLKANTELKNVFQRLFKTMGLNVAWNELFIVINNNLILPGSVRSLFFQFDHKKIATNIVDIPIKEDDIEQIDENVMLSNILNMTLYAFGKWGIINGLKVEKDYAQLNHLFTNILKEVKIEPSFRDDNFRFFKEGMQITYEDVIQEVLNLKKEEEEKGIVAEGEGEDDNSEYGLGLWHNMRWIKESHQFLKQERDESNDTRLRLGDNFYTVDYKCPDCGDKLHMVIFPIDQEVLIETDEERVYLARAYTCNVCNCFYTPIPQKLLQEGDVYALKFNEDRRAYDDYKELLGRTGTRSTNYKLNEYESVRRKKESEPPQTSLAELCDGIGEMSGAELRNLKDKMDCGFYPWQEAEQYDQIVEMQLTALRRGGSDTGSTAEKQFKAGKSAHDFSVKTIKELKEILTNFTREGGEGAGELPAAVREQLSHKLKIKYDASMGQVMGMGTKGLWALREEIESEQLLKEEDRKGFISNIDMVLYRKEVKEISQKTESCKDKSYSEITHTMEEIESGSAPDELKAEALKTLSRIKKIRGEKEVGYFIANIPEGIDKKQYRLLREKIAKYPEVDIAPYEKQLKRQYDLAEKQEISAFIKQAPKRDRADLLKLYSSLREQDYSESNRAPFLEKINDKIMDMDRAAIQKICPDIMELSFAEGIKAFEEISAGIFLPQLKANTLEMLNRRLTKIKLDECSQLVRKLQRDVDEKIHNHERLHFYDLRKSMREETDPCSVIIDGALDTYASGRNQYEFPILVCDTSHSETGREGFVLTPDNIFYHKLFSSGTINIGEINSIAENMGILNRGIFLTLLNGKNFKLPVSLKASEWKEFAGLLNDFVSYLKEKPESRSIAYMAKDKHEVKCCYRCGYSYKGGGVCPKCGSKANA